MTDTSSPETPAGQPLLKVSGLKVYYHISQGIVKAVDDIDFTVGCGEFVGLSGERMLILILKMVSQSELQVRVHVEKVLWVCP